MLARFDLVLGVGASWDPEVLGIQRYIYILELQLDRFSALEVARTLLYVHLKSGDVTPFCLWVGTFLSRSRGGCLV